MTQHGFTFDGIHSSTFGIEVLEKNDPLLPPIKDKKEEIDGMPGAWDFGCTFGPRPISYVISFTDIARANLQSTIRNIARWLNPQKGQKALVDDDEPGRFYLARLTGNIPIERLIYLYREFTISFLAFDPIARGDNIVWQDIVDIGVFKVNNPGSYEVKPIITIKALDGGLMLGDLERTGAYDSDGTVNDTITNPVLTLNGRTVSFAGVLNVGESIVIDCLKMQAMKGALNALSALTVSEFPILGPGDNNLTMTDETSTSGGLVKVEYYGRWL